MFIVGLFIAAKTWKYGKMFIRGEWTKEHVSLYGGMLLCSRKEHTLDPQQPGWVLKTLCRVTGAGTLHTA